MMSSQATENINNRFFQGLYKEVWRKLIHPGLTQAECDFLSDVIKLSKGTSVLDIMCGYGRHALELARRGGVVTALDNLQDYTQEIETVANKEGLSVTAISGDVLDYTSEKEFDAVICMGNSFAFFDQPSTKKLLHNIARQLKQGGSLVINSWMIAEIAIRHFKEKDWMQVGEYKYLLDYHFKFHPSRIESEHTIIRNDGAMEVIQGVDFIFTLDELREMIADAGLEIVSSFATPRKKPFALGDSTIYIVAEKR